MSAFRTKALGAFAALAIAGSGYVFSQRSLNNIVEVRPELQELVKCALDKSPIDFAVVDGLRTDEEHKANVANGVSWIKRSKHQDGKAVDVAAYVDGKITWKPEYYYPISGAFYLCSELLETPIIMGGEWRVKDYMHVELK
jgi:peptidoglycan LD-endopeptidase CwlK